MTGWQTGTKVTTSADGELGGPFLVASDDNIFQATGTMTTTIGEHVYTQPANGT